MRYAIISDIHSNLEAFGAVLDDIERKGIHEIVSLGDIIGYNANPNECVELIRQKRIRSIKGNHGESVMHGPAAVYDFNIYARAALEWTHNNLTDENKEFIYNLPTSMMIDGKFLIVHGSIQSTDAYIFNVADAENNFKLLEGRGVKICFFGHTHIPAVFEDSRGKARKRRAQDFFLDRSSLYLINPGAVGQPRDGDPRASYGIYDSVKGDMTFCSVNYDVETAAKKVVEAELPFALAARLKRGG